MRARSDARSVINRCSRLLRDGVDPSTALSLEEARGSAYIVAAWLNEAIETFDLNEEDE